MHKAEGGFSNLLGCTELKNNFVRCCCVLYAAEGFGSCRCRFALNFVQSCTRKFHFFVHFGYRISGNGLGPFHAGVTPLSAPRTEVSTATRSRKCCSTHTTTPFAQSFSRNHSIKHVEGARIYLVIGTAGGAAAAAARTCSGTVLPTVLWRQRRRIHVWTSRAGTSTGKFKGSRIDLSAASS